MMIEENPGQRFPLADAFVDTHTGLTFSESPHYPGFVHVSDVCVGALGKSAWEGALYLDGGRGPLYVNGGKAAPNLGEDLLYRGSSEQFMAMGIHPVDVPKFVQRVLAWRAVTENVLVERREDGTFEEHAPHKRELGEALGILDEYRRTADIASFVTLD